MVGIGNFVGLWTLVKFNFEKWFKINYYLSTVFSGQEAISYENDMI